MKLCGDCVHCEFYHEAKLWTGHDTWTCQEALEGAEVDPEEEAPERCFKEKPKSQSERGL
jgi:hypothetical protein